MIELVKLWLLRVTAASLIAALADSLMPKGPVRQVGRLVCALVVLWAVVSPALELDMPGLDQAAGQLREQTGQRRQSLEQESGRMLKILIQRECSAYIVDKAEELGAVCTAQVTCAPGEGGIWLPQQAQITGELTQEQRDRLEQLIQTELGVPPQQQSYIGGETE